MVWLAIGLMMATVFQGYQSRSKIFSLEGGTWAFLYLLAWTVFLIQVAGVTPPTEAVIAWGESFSHALHLTS
ncbi:hypothetical protein D2Q93_05730 [Alicyclobacillaceae bacterium I2511]|nr:hypothetical protein D2Q93_05730 [Alicyclobacillaceae bacterium I2511]